MKPPPLLRLADAARQYGISKTTLIRLRRKNLLKVFTTRGGQNMFFREDIEAYINSNSTIPDERQEKPNQG